MYGFYLYYVIGVMIIFPLISFLIDSAIAKKKKRNFEIIELLAKWFIFWGVGMRSFTAGLSQVINPGFTASILEVPEEAFVAVREIGLANLSMGIIALLTLFFPSWRKGGGSAGALYLGCAGFLHIFRIHEGINIKEWTAMISDLWIFGIVLIYLILSFTAQRKTSK